jgi:microcystin-dependent protein
MKTNMKINMKTKNLVVLLVILLFQVFLKAQVGVNIVTPHPSAAMQIQSPAGLNKGLLTPSMTTTQRAAIVSPADGLIVYDISNKMHFMYEAASASWLSMSPLRLRASGAATVVTGIISTPTTTNPTTYSLGINTQTPSQALDVVGNSTISGNSSVGGNATISGSLNVNGFPSNALIPAGLICMFSGSLIPFGWALCDGTTYGAFVTPDLRGRFIVGVDNIKPAIQLIATGQYMPLGLIPSQTPTLAPNDGVTLNYGKPGNIGGETGHALALAEMPAHTHSVTVSPTISSFNFTPSGITWVGTGTAYSGDPSSLPLSVNETSKGSNQIHENRPPYYVLAYIIKLP